MVMLRQKLVNMIEIEPKYCETAKQRMIREISQPCLPTMEPERQVKQSNLL